MTKRYFAASTFSVRQDGESWNAFKRGAIELLGVIKGGLPSWKLLAGCSAFTHLPNSVLHLWRLKDASALIAGKAYFEEGDGEQYYDLLTGSSGLSRLQLLEATSYDPAFEPKVPAPPPPAKDGRYYFLWVEISLRPGKEKRAAFDVACGQLLKSMKKDLTSWKLIAAGSTVTGPANTVMHLWQLDDADALLEGMNWFGENNAAYSDLAECCLRQKQQLFTSMSYNPLGGN